LGANEVVICIHENDDVMWLTVFFYPEKEVCERPHLHLWVYKLDFVLKGVVGRLQMVDDSFKVLLRRVVINIHNMKIGIVHSFNGFKVTFVFVLGEYSITH
jgi:hypothetical protein